MQFREALHDAVELGHLYTVVATREDDEPGPSTRHASTFVSRRIYGYQALVHARRALATAKVHCNSEEVGFGVIMCLCAMGCTEEMEETE